MLEKIKYPSLNRLVSQKLKLLKEEDVDYIKRYKYGNLIINGNLLTIILKFTMKLR